MTSVSSAAKLVYGQLARHAGRDGNAYPSYATLAKSIGLGERQIMRLAKELTEARLVTVRKRTHENGRQRSNAYVFLWHEAFETRVPEVQIEGDMVDPEYDESVTGEGDTDVNPQGDGSVTHKRVLSEQSPSEKGNPVRQQQQQSAAPQQGPAQSAAVAAPVLVSRFPKTLDRLRKSRFPTAKPGQKWERLCAESGFSDKNFDEHVFAWKGIDWVEHCGKGATSPIPVIEEAIEYLKPAACA
jgi:hypothetical protein